MTNQKIIDTLSDLQQAVRAREFTKIKENFEILYSEYNSIRGDEAEFNSRIDLIRSEIDVVDNPIITDVTEYLGANSQVSLARSNILLSLEKYSTDPTGQAADTLRKDLIEQINDVQKLEKNLLNAAQKIEKKITEIDIHLPPELIIRSIEIEDAPYILDTAYELELFIQNVGDTRVEDVSVQVKSPDPVSVSPGVTNVGGLNGGEKASVTTSAKSETAGEYRLNIIAGAKQEDIGGGADTVQFSVIDTSTISLQAINTIEQTHRRLSDADLDHGLTKSLESKLKAALKKTKKGRSLLNNSKKKKARTQFNAAIKILGAFLNQVEESDKISRALSQRVKISLINLGEAAIDQESIIIKSLEDNDDEGEDNDDEGENNSSNKK